MLAHIHVLSFFPRTEKMTKHKKWNKNRILVLGKRYVYLYRLTIHKVGNKTVFFVRLGKMKVILWCPESFIRVRPYVFLLVLCRYKYISIFVYLNLNFFMVTCVICRRLRLKYVDTVKSPNQSNECDLYINFKHWTINKQKSNTWSSGLVICQCC